jgi:hypothetical protein
MLGQVSALIYNPLGKLVGVTRTFAFADHIPMMP